MISRLSPARRGLIITAFGSSLTISWASSYYIPAVLAAPMAEDLGLSPVGSVAKTLRSSREAQAGCHLGHRARCSFLEQSDSLLNSTRTNTKGPFDNPSFSKDVI